MPIFSTLRTFSSGMASFSASSSGVDSRLIFIGPMLPSRMKSRNCTPR
jgi:hypothetical protein